MNSRSISSSNGHGEEYLDRAISALLSLPMPAADALQRAIRTAVSWETGVVVSRSWTRRRWSIALAAAISAAAVVVIGCVLLMSGPADQPAQVNADEEVKGEPAKEAAAKQAKTRFFEPVAMTNPVVADAAPIMICIGPEKPVKLGEVVPHVNIHGLDPSVVRLHIWDWSKSNLSRVMLIQRSELGVLSPDGKKMLSPEGEVMDLESHETRQFSGFHVKDGQRMSAVQFSLANKHVAAMIHAGTRIEKDLNNPALSGAIHSWSLRLLRLDTATHVGKNLGEFPAQSSAGIAFTPDETSFVYESDKHSIIRRDLSGGKILNEYQPAIGTHGAVGITISPDGRFVAAGQYHGKLYIWETVSGKLLVDHQFLRDNGEQDTFFQAKVLRFSPDGERLAMASGNRLKVLETKTGKILKQHYHETTPAFAHLQWSPDAKKITLVTYSEPTEFAAKDRFPPRPTADIFPRVYEWDWQAAEPRLKQFP